MKKIMIHPKAHIERILPVLISLSLLGGFLAGVTGCQSSRSRELENVKEGMQKDQVLETAGGPTIARRWHGKDRWIYQIYDHNDESKRETREVHFENGHAIYVGAQYIPKVSAQEQDRLNDESNKAEDERLAQQKLERDVYLNIVRLNASDDATKTAQAKVLKNLDPDEQRFREATYGADLGSSPTHSAHFEEIQ